MRITILALIAPLFFACSEKSDETVDLEEIMPTSNYDKIERKDSIIEIKSFYPAISKIEIEANDIKWDSISINEELTVPERFKPTRVEKFDYYIGETMVEVKSWSFGDSVKSLKAFLNWMNCYGDRCSMIELKTPINIQRNGLLIMQSDTCIIQVQTAMVGNNELKKWKKLYTSSKDVKWNYIILQPKGAKASWTTFKDEKEIELTPSTYN